MKILETNKEGLLKGLTGLWIAGVCLALVFWGGVTYVAWHFISKWW